MVIIDTTVWADYFIGRRTPQTDWLDAQADLRRLGIGDLILCEVLQGIRDEEQAETVCGELLNFELVAVGGAEVAVAAARNHRLLRARGRTAPGSIHCLIAAACLQNGFALLHSDPDFDLYEEALGLQVIHPGNNQRQTQQENRERTPNGRLA